MSVSVCLQELLICRLASFYKDNSNQKVCRLRSIFLLLYATFMSCLQTLDCNKILLNLIFVDLETKLHCFHCLELIFILPSFLSQVILDCTLLWVCSLVSSCFSSNSYMTCPIAFTTGCKNAILLGNWGWEWALRVSINERISNKLMSLKFIHC